MPKTAETGPAIFLKEIVRRSKEQKGAAFQAIPLP